MVRLHPLVTLDAWIGRWYMKGDLVGSVVCQCDQRRIRSVDDGHRFTFMINVLFLHSLPVSVRTIFWHRRS